MALMDAGIPMRSLFAGVGCALVEDAGSRRLMLDATAEEEAEAVACMQFSFANTCPSRPGAPSVGTGGLVIAETEGGPYSEAEYLAAVDGCGTAVEAIFAFMRKTMERRHAKVLAQVATPVAPAAAARTARVAK